MPDQLNPSLDQLKPASRVGKAINIFKKKGYLQLAWLDIVVFAANCISSYTLHLQIRTCIALRLTNLQKLGPSVEFIDFSQILRSAADVVSGLLKLLDFPIMGSNAGYHSNKVIQL